VNGEQDMLFQANRTGASRMASGAQKAAPREKGLVVHERKPLLIVVALLCASLPAHAATDLDVMKWLECKGPMTVRDRGEPDVRTEYSEIFRFDPAGRKLQAYQKQKETLSPIGEPIQGEGWEMTSSATVSDAYLKLKEETAYPATGGKSVAVTSIARSDLSFAYSMTTTFGYAVTASGSCTIVPPKPLKKNAI